MKPVDHEVAVIGTGFSGLGMAIQLERGGREDYVVFERATSLGGTWRDNRYPGCACDVPAPLYSFSFAPNSEWSRLYAPQAEIRAYLEDCADRFGVRQRVRFGTGVETARWDEQGQRWVARLSDGSETTARFAVAGVGGLTEPALPEIEGIEGYGGRLAHSADWDEDLELAGKRVAVIGTGASAIQLVPHLAERAERLTVYQRTAPWVLPQPDLPMPRPARWLFRRLPAAQRALRGLIWAIQESVALPLAMRPSLVKGLEALGRAHLRRAIADPGLRRRLTPGYALGCKRILLSNHYFPALARPNVDVVTAPIERVENGGIVDGEAGLREVDVIVCATGFDIREALAGTELVGLGGRTLREVWAERIEAHRGTMIAGFPNLFMLSGPNTGTGNMSQVFMIEAQLAFVGDALERMRRAGAAELRVRPEAQAAFNRELVERMEGTVWLTGGCQSWYLTDEGHTGVLWPGFSTEFRRSLRRMRPEEYELLPPLREASELAADMFGSDEGWSSRSPTIPAGS